MLAVGLLGLFSYTFLDRLPGVVLLIVGWVLQHPLFIKKTAPHACILGNQMSIFSTEVLSSQMMLVYIRQNKIR